MIRLLFMTLSFIGALAINIAANVLPFNGQTTGELSNRLPVLFTPAPYVFSIWFLIYLLLAGWLVRYGKQVKNGQAPSMAVAAFFIAANILNGAWLFSWHYEAFLLSVFLLAGYLLSLACLYFQYGNFDNRRLPIAVNFGWVTVALFANIHYVLTYYNWSGFGLSDPLWAVITLTLAAAIALHIRYHHFDVAFPLVVIWAFIGIAWKHGFSELLVTTASLFLSGVIAAGIVFIKKRQA